MSAGPQSVGFEGGAEFLFSGRYSRNDPQEWMRCNLLELNVD
jgi:hypothetical protein